VEAGEDPGPEPQREVVWRVRLGDVSHGQAVEDALASLPGVRLAYVDPGERTVFVRCDPTILSQEELSAAVANEGIDVLGEPEGTA
jgi:copper chaperone CopZ